MGDVTIRRVTTVRHEYALRSPVPVGEVEKAVQVALANLPEERRGWADALMIEARDDEIVIWWEQTGEAD